MNATRQLLLGLFFLSALAILALYTVFGTDTVNLFSEPLQLRVYFPEAIGLREGDPVQAVGVRVGRVKTLEIDIKAAKRERVLAVLNLNEELELTEGVTVVIEESTLLGGRHVSIDPGDPGGVPLVLGEGEAIYGAVQKNPIEGLAEVGDVFAENRAAIANIVDNLDAMVAGAREGKGPLGRILTDEKLSEDMAALVADIASAASKIDSGEGLLGALISDPTLAEDARSIFDRVDAIVADLQAGKGIAGRLIYDESLADQAASAVESIASASRKIDEGEGTIGRLLNDEAMAESLSGAVDSFGRAGDDIAALTAQVRTGEGTLGKLFMDQELYDEVLVTVKLLTRSLEDYREAAPVSAFTSVLFSGF